MKHARHTALLLVFVLASAAAHAGSRWTEEDFKPRPVVSYPVSWGPDLARTATVIGVPEAYQFRKNDTMHDLARHFGLGINEVQAAFPDIDVWIPPEGETRHFPTWWVLPEGDHKGLVINVPEMRIYYYPGTKPPTAITYAVGLGRDEWQTPVGRFKISEKTVNPTWVIPESIRAERIRDKGRHERAIPGGHPDNPLGRYRMRLTLPLYGIHSTNIPWGVGMKVSHGCVRLYPEDIERLFPLVPVGTSGEFVYQPVKVGARQGRIYVEVHPAIYDQSFDYWNEASLLLKNKSWDNLVDWRKLAEAIDRKSGVPTRISGLTPVPRDPDVPVSEARRQVPEAPEAPVRPN